MRTEDTYAAPAHDIAVERTSFFDSTLGALRYVERRGAPSEHERHVDCACTMTVTGRPLGQPTHVTQALHFASKRKSGALTVTLRESAGVHDRGLYWTFTWGNPDVDALGTGSQPHAYFWFSGREQSAQIEIVPTVFSRRVPDDYISAMLYMGNKIDTSLFFNGHSPSRVIDLSTIGDRELWLHDAHSFDASEPWMRIGDGFEAATWRPIFDMVARVGDRAAPIVGETSASIDAVHELASADSQLAADVDVVSGWLDDFVGRAAASEIGQWARARRGA